MAAEDSVTAVISTSCARIHPSTEHIAAVVGSVRFHLPHSEIVIVADGLRTEQVNRAEAYSDYLRRLVRLTAEEWDHVTTVCMPNFVHQANTTREALGRVRTPLILYLEHDTPLLEDPIEWDYLTDRILDGTADVIRLHHVPSVLRSWHLLDPEPSRRHLLRTLQWSQRPHLASLAFYRRVMDYFGPDCRTYIEDIMRAVLYSYWCEYGELGWAQFRLWLYAPDGPSVQRSTHLHSRGEEKKYPVSYAYGRPQPFGAPANGRWAYPVRGYPGWTEQDFASKVRRATPERGKID